MIAGHCILPHMFSIRSWPLKCAHTPTYCSHTYLYIIQTFIGYLLNVKNQDVCGDTKINPTYTWSLPSENSKSKPRKGTERKALKQGGCPIALAILHNCAITKEATGTHFHLLLLYSSLWIWWAGAWRRQAEWTSPSHSTRAAAAWSQTSRNCPQQFRVHPGSHLFLTWGTR